MNTNLNRLIALRDEGFSLARQKEAEGLLDFTTFSSNCGSYRCLLGWWIETPTAKCDGWRLRIYTTSKGFYETSIWWDDYRSPLEAARRYFGITDKDWLKLFGANTENTLDARLEYLNELIRNALRP